jgi:predicted glycosyltransferase
LPHRPVICASVRDILAPPSKPEKATKTETLLTTYYDAVLVHADQKVTPLDLSWPVSNNLRPMLHYTGFVAPPPAAAHPEKAGQGEIIVTAGGGDVGAHIFDAAIAAAAQSDLTWRILLGGADAGRRATELTSVTTSNVILEPARSDFRQMLHHAAACVAMCGYNTALDLLQTGCPAVLIPFDAGGEVEQGIRANALANLPGFDVLKAVELTPERLLSAIASVCQSAPRTPALEGFDGAVQTVRIVERLEAKRK